MKSPKIHNQGILGALHLSLCVLKKVSFFPPGGGGDSHMEQMGMLVGNFEFNP